MHEIALKPLIHAHDMVCSVVNVGNSSRAGDLKSVENRAGVIEHMQLLIGELAESPDFEMCRLGAERLREAVIANRDVRQITADAQSLRTRILDQSQSLFCFVLSRRERD